MQIRLDRETRQQQIVEAARHIIATGGLDALTIRAIADRVGVTEAAIYRHVPSKDDVLLLLVEDIRSSLFTAITRATEDDRHALARLEHLLQLHLSHIESRRAISFILIAEALQFCEPRVKAAVKGLLDDYLALVERTLAQGQARGELAPDLNPGAAATMFFGMVQASVTRWLFDSTAHPLTENATALWRMFRSSLAAGSHRPAVAASA